MRDRLIEFINYARLYGDGTSESIADYLLANGVVLVDTEKVGIVNNREPIQTAFGMPLDELADLIRATEDGRIIVPLCNVGDTVWDRGAEPWRVISIEWFSQKATHLHCVSPVTGVRHTFSVGKRSVGKTVFLTREEAENALAERSRQ